MRSIAILSVVVGHSSEFLSRLFDAPYIGNAVKEYVSFVQPCGQLGVELFFVLSGYLIGNILIKTYIGSADLFFADIRRFWIRRWFRTLPVYWLVLSLLSILYIFMKLDSHETYRLFYYVFIQNLWYPHPRFFFGEAWSLSVEEWFYLTLPVVLLVCHRVFKPGNKRAFLIRVFSGYLLFFGVLRFLNAFHPVNGPDIDFGIRKVVVFRLDAVMYGVIFAWINSFHFELLSKIKNYLLAIGIIGICFLYYLLTNAGVALCNSSPSKMFATNAFLYLLLPLSFSFWLPFASQVKTLDIKIFSSFFRYISKISYSMYLVHYSLIFIPFFCFLKITSHKETVLLYLLYWSIVLLVSSLLYRYFENPVMQLREKYSRQDDQHM